MSEEEKEAINNLNFIIVTDIYDNEVKIDKTKIVNEYNESVGIVLNLISNLQKENEELHKELDKKDKVIDKMAENIASVDFDLCAYIDLTTKNNKCKDTKHCKDCIKQYFYKKAEDKEKDE